MAILLDNSTCHSVLGIVVLMLTAVLVVVVQMHQTDMLEWDETDAGEAAMPPPQMVVDVVSDDVLQATVTKTALDVFSTLSRVCERYTANNISATF